MSWLSSAIGKIPVVGHGINQIGKILPSGGQILGGLALGPIGNALGGAIDGNTTPLQKNIGNSVDLAAAGIGAAGLAGAGPAAAAASGGASAGSPTSIASILAGLKNGAGAVSGFVGGHPGLVDTGLGALAGLNAANLSKQSTQYAHNAMDTANQSYDSRAPLRLAGVQGMLNPKPSSGPIALPPGNPFAPKPTPLSQVG